VRDLPNLSKSGRMLGWFSRLVNSWFASIYQCFRVKSSPILSCNIFHFHNFQRYFWPDFRSCDLRSFSSIPSMGLGARTSLTIYLQHWSKSIAVASLTWRISPEFTKTYIFWVHPKSEEKFFNLGKPSLGTCSLRWGDPCVQVSFHFMPRSLRIKDGQKRFGLGHELCTVLGRPE
jgi:hypothetical protein